MNHTHNLPLGIIIHEESNLELETLNPVNGPPLAIIATKEDIDAGGGVVVEIAQSAVSLNYRSSTDAPVSGSQPEETAGINRIENLDLGFDISRDRKNINKFINIRRRALILYSPILLLNLLYIFVNPTGILFILNILYNLFTLISANIEVIKSNILSNIITVVVIILVDIFFAFNINTLLFYILKRDFNIFNVEVYYLITLYISSILIITTYLYLTICLNKLRVLYKSFSPHQINVLNLLLKNT